MQHLGALCFVGVSSGSVCGSDCVAVCVRWLRCLQALCRDARCVPAGGASELEMARQVGLCSTAAASHASMVQHLLA